jgi:alanine racemase
LIEARSTDPAPDRPRLTVDLDALARNYARLRTASGQAETAAVAKADAYGLGVEPIVGRLLREGCRTFFVASADEGARVRALAPEAQVVVLNGVLEGEERLFLALSLTPALQEPAQLARWLAAAKGGPARPAALFLDSGMNRLGFSKTQLEQALAGGGFQGDEIGLVISHFACASTPAHPMNAEQIGRFRTLLEAARARFPKARASLANSAGIFLGPEAHFDLTRPGIALYGGAPLDDRSIAMEAVAALHAPILQVRELAPGERVGYGADCIVDRPTRAATVALGYADGFLRGAGGRGYGVLGDRRAPILGRVSMDLITLDVTRCGSAARPGALVELLGPNALLDDQAEAAGTANYELLVRLGPRIARSIRGAGA